MDSKLAGSVVRLPLVSRVYVRSGESHYSDAQAYLGESVSEADGYMTRFRLPRRAAQALRSFRVDPVECPGLCRIRKVALRGGNGRVLVSWLAPLLEGLAYNVNAVVLSAPGDDEYVLWSLHDDPYFELDADQFAAELEVADWSIELHWSFEPIEGEEGLQLARKLLEHPDLTAAIRSSAPHEADAFVHALAFQKRAVGEFCKTLIQQQADALRNANLLSSEELRRRLLRAALRFSRRAERREARVRQRADEVTLRLESSSQQLSRQSNRMDALELELASLRQQLAEATRPRPSMLYRWRASAARLRAYLGRQFQSRWDYLRVAAFDVRPIADVIPDSNSPEPGHWVVNGGDPSFYLESAAARALTAGWYLFETDVQVNGDGVLIEPCLYADYGQGMSEATRIPLQLPDRNGKPQLLQLSGDVVRLRLDPSVSSCRFGLSMVRMRKLTGIEVALRLAAPFMRGRWLHVPTVLSVSWQFLRLLATQGRFGVRARLVDLYSTGVTVTGSYSHWVSRYDTLEPQDRDSLRAHAQRLDYKPLISIVMPVYETPEHWLRRCIDSVLAQVYTNWELCIADDASRSPHVRRVLEEYSGRDARIRFVVREKNGHISASSNSALELAHGDYVALLDHDDELAEHALYHVAEALNQQPRAKLLYSDEDKIDEAGVRFDPYFKTEWNPDLFRGHNMISHLGVYERKMLHDMGGFRLGFEGSQDYDLALRCIERLDRTEIRHIPRILYHWRAIAGSTALGPQEKNYAHVAARRSLEAHLDRIGLEGKVFPIERHPGNWRLSYALQGQPEVAVIVPTRNGLEYLQRCIDSVLQKSTYSRYRIYVVDNQSDDSRVLSYLQTLRGGDRTDVVAFDEPFNFSRLNNFAAGIVSADFLIFLNNDTEVITPGWIEELVSLAQRPGIGAVGAMLYYPNDTIQHAGILLGVGADRIAGHAYHMKPRGYPGDKCRARLVQEVSAVTAACMAIKRERFDQAGGFDEALTVAFNDVDLCLRLNRIGYRNLWTPNAELYHFESVTRGSDIRPERRAHYLAECAAMRQRWGDLLLNDPYYHPALSLDGNDFLTQTAPRLKNPWQAVPDNP